MLRLFAALTLLGGCSAKVEGIKDSQQSIIRIGNGTGYEGIQDVTSKLLAIDDNSVDSAYTCQDQEGLFALAITKGTKSAGPRGRMYRRNSDDSFELLNDTGMNRSENALQPSIIHYETWVPKNHFEHWNLTISGNEAPIGNYFIPSTIEYDHLGAAQYASGGDVPFYCRPTGESTLDEVVLYNRIVPPSTAQDYLIHFRGLEAQSYYRRLTHFAEESTQPPVVFGKNIACSRVAYATQPDTNPFNASYNCTVYLKDSGQMLDLSTADANTKQLVSHITTFHGNVWDQEMSAASTFQGGKPGSLYAAGFKLVGGGSQEANPMNLESDGIFRVKWDGYDATMVYRYLDGWVKRNPQPVAVTAVPVNATLSYREITMSALGLRCYSQLKVIGVDANNKPLLDNVDRTLQTCEVGFDMMGAAADTVSLLPATE